MKNHDIKRPIVDPSEVEIHSESIWESMGTFILVLLALEVLAVLFEVVK